MQEVEKLCDHVVVVSHGRTVAAGTVDELLARTGQRDFEEAFVRLAFSADERAHREARVGGDADADMVSHVEPRESDR
jgi:sodium transport system ATP-binding protein